MNLSACPLEKGKGGPLKPRYVWAIMLEFMRALFDNGIPLQNTLQNLFLSYLIDADEMDLVHQLLQFHVLNDSPELSKTLIQVGSKHQKKEYRYEPGYQLGVDMLKRLQMHDNVVQTLMEEDHVMKALDYAHETQVTGIKIPKITENIELAKNQGDDIKAHMLANRLAAMKLVSKTFSLY